MDEAGPDCHVLLTTDHPKSLRTLAWTRQHNKSRVFVLASGHDQKTYANPNFRTVLLRGIQWAAGRI
jgi:type 1 glutamine amidotransferase